MRDNRQPVTPARKLVSSGFLALLWLGAFMFLTRHTSVPIAAIAALVLDVVLVVASQ